MGDHNTLSCRRNGRYALQVLLQRGRYYPDAMYPALLLLKIVEKEGQKEGEVARTEKESPGWRDDGSRTAASRPMEGAHSWIRSVYSSISVAVGG